YVHRDTLLPQSTMLFPYTTLFRSLINLEPSTSPGNNFTTSAPETRALYISVKVETPGNQGMPASRQTRPTSGLKIGCTIKSAPLDRKSTRLNSSHVKISYAVFCLK